MDLINVIVIKSVAAKEVVYICHTPVDGSRVAFQKNIINGVIVNNYNTLSETMVDTPHQFIEASRVYRCLMTRRYSNLIYLKEMKVTVTESIIAWLKLMFMKYHPINQRGIHPLPGS